MNRILITGGGGFLGAWIVRKLAETKSAVRILDRAVKGRSFSQIAADAADGVEWAMGDIADAGAVADAAQNCNTIIHLAALLTPACKDDPVRGATVNLIGTLNIFEAAKKHGIHNIVYASSAAVFGSDDGEMPAPITHYGAFKLACEGCARAYAMDDGIHSIGFRPTIIYGPGRELGLTAGVTTACREAAAGRAYTIPFSGAQDFVFVEDAAAAFAAAATTRYVGAHAYSLIGGTADVRDVVAAIQAEIPKADISINGPTVPMAPVITPTPFTVLRGTLPRTSLRDGIAATIRYYQTAAGA